MGPRRLNSRAREQVIRILTHMCDVLSFSDQGNGEAYVEGRNNSRHGAASNAFMLLGARFASACMRTAVSDLPDERSLSWVLARLSHRATVNNRQTGLDQRCPRQPDFFPHKKKAWSAACSLQRCWDTTGLRLVHARRATLGKCPRRQFQIYHPLRSPTADQKIATIPAKSTPDIPAEHT